jgi:hypothetical protein
VSTGYFKILPAFEMYHIPDSGGRPVSNVAMLDHNMTAAEFAEQLELAREWYKDISLGRVAPRDRHFLRMKKGVGR